MTQNIMVSMAIGTATTAIGGAVAATVLSSPLGIAVGAPCAGVGYFEGTTIQVLYTTMGSSNLGSLIGVAARIACTMAAVLLLAPLWGIHLTLLGSFIFSSVVFTIESVMPLRPALDSILLANNRDDQRVRA